MASTGKKWTIGCGIGCLLMLLVAGGVGTVGFFGFKRISERGEVLEVQMDEVEERFGETASFVPAADGRIDAASIQIFLTAQDDLHARSTELAGYLRALDGEGGAIDKVRAGINLIPSMMEFIGNRAAVMLDHDLHPGEYTYIYAVAYYSWLRHDPGDGPGFRLSGDDDDDGNVRWRNRGGNHDVHEERARETRRGLNDLMITWLQGQRDATEAAGGDAAWAAALDSELAALQGDSGRLAWEEGLPERLESSLAPYRDELEAAYSPLHNGLEAALLAHD